MRRATATIARCMPFFLHFPIQPAAQQVGDAARVVPVGLVDLRGKRGGDLPCIHADHLQALRAQRLGEVNRELPGLQAHERHRQLQRPQRIAYGERLACHLAGMRLLSLFIDHTDGRVS